MAYAGTLVVQGNARGLVVETGEHTEIGRISELLRGVETLRTPLLQQLDRAGRVLAIFIMAAAVLTAAFGVLVHGPTERHHPPPARGGDPGLDLHHLLRQDRHADA
jgi:Ca2+-transporting ATPase